MSESSSPKIMSESSSSDEEESVDTSIDNSVSLKKTVGDSGRNEVPVAKRPRKTNEEDVEISTEDMSVNNSSSLKKVVGGSARNEISVVKSPREEEETEQKTIDEKRVKKNYFERVWSEEDEVVLLEGVIGYRKESGNDDTKGAYEEVSKSISFDVSKIQFKEKLRSLKKKYEKKVIKAKKNGEDPTFVKPHDGKVFELSKLLWGVHGESTAKLKGEKSKKRPRNNEDNGGDEVMNKEKLVAQEREMFMKTSVVKSLTRFGMEESVALQGWSWLDVEYKKRLEDEWKAFHIQEVELDSQKAELDSKKTSSIKALMAEIGEVFKLNL